MTHAFYYLSMVITGILNSKRKIVVGSHDVLNIRSYILGVSELKDASQFFVCISPTLCTTAKINSSIFDREINYLLNAILHVLMLDALE